MHNFLLFAISPYLLQVTSAMPTESDCLVSVNTETFCIADQDILFIFMYYFKSNVKFLNCLLSNKIIKEPLNKMDKCTEIHKTIPIPTDKDMRIICWVPTKSLVEPCHEIIILLFMFNRKLAASIGAKLHAF